MGANLAVGGRVVGDCLECPFHGWQFRGSDGQCTKIPYSEKGTKRFLHEKCEFLVHWLTDTSNVIIFTISKSKLISFLLEILYTELCYLITVGILNLKLSAILRIVPDIAKVKSYISDEANGYIYFWYHAEDSAPTWTVPRIEEIQSGDWVYRGRTEHYINCHIEVLRWKRVNIFTHSNLIM